MADVTQTPIPSESLALEAPIWQKRIRLVWRQVRNNVALFAENPIGLIGLGIIFAYAMMIVIYPILMGSVWDPNIYHPVVGIDISIPFHSSAP